jgi:hypothetical protein
MIQPDTSVNVSSYYATGTFLCSEVAYVADSGFLSTSECQELSNSISEICGCTSEGQGTPSPSSITTEGPTENPSSTHTVFQLLPAIALGGVISANMIL